MGPGRGTHGVLRRRKGIPSLPAVFPTAPGMGRRDRLHGLAARVSDSPLMGTGFPPVDARTGRTMGRTIRRAARTQHRAPARQRRTRTRKVHLLPRPAATGVAGLLHRQRGPRPSRQGGTATHRDGAAEPGRVRPAYPRRNTRS